MKSSRLPAWIAGLGLLAGHAASATTVTVLSTDFEAPAFQVGAVDGQSDWYNSYAGPVPAVISTAQAHSGTQSLRSGTANSFTAFPGSNFDVSFQTDWWAQAWVYVLPGGTGATIGFGNVFGGCPILTISGAGLPYFNTCRAQDIDQPSQGANLLGQWVQVQMSHQVSDQNAVRFTVTGPNVTVTSFIGPYSGPGGGNPAILTLFGDAYWDDVSAGYGPLPIAAAVPSRPLPSNSVTRRPRSRIALAIASPLRVKTRMTWRPNAKYCSIMIPTKLPVAKPRA